MKLSTTPEIQRTLSISTGNLSENSRNFLSSVEARYKSLLVYDKEGYGWFVVVDPDRDYRLEDEITSEIPIDMRRILTIAQRLDCDKLDIDCDAPQYDLDALENSLDEVLPVK